MDILRRFTILATLVLVAPGCVTAAVALVSAYGVIKYKENEALRDFDADVDKTWDVTLSSMRELGYPVQEGAPRGSAEGEIDINDAWVRVQKHGPGVTRVRVKIGTFDTYDHRVRAELLLDTIAKQLTTATVEG